MGSRRKARVLAFQALYAWEFNRVPLEDLTGFSWLDKDYKLSFKQDTIDFARILVAGVLENIEYIDQEIRTHLDHWDFNRLSKVELAILRMGVFSLFFQKEIPISVTIDEAIDISKDFGGEDSYRFINGVLDGIRKSSQL